MGSSPVVAPCPLPACAGQIVLAVTASPRQSPIGTPINSALVQERPDDPRRLIGLRDGGNLEGASGEKRLQPRPRPKRRFGQPARRPLPRQRGESGVLDFPFSIFVPTALCLRLNEAAASIQPGGKVASRLEPAGIRHKRLDGRRRNGADARDRGRPTHVLVVLGLHTIARSSLSIWSAEASISSAIAISAKRAAAAGVHLSHPV